MVPGGVNLFGSGPCRPVPPVHAIGRGSVKRARRPDFIVEGHVNRGTPGVVVDGLIGVQASNRLQLPKDLFHPLADPLADRVAPVPYRPSNPSPACAGR